MADLASPRPGIKVDTPLSTRQPLATDGLSVTELPLLGKITLRGNADDNAFAAAAKEVLNVDLPTVPLTTARNGGVRVFWIAFDEWMIWTPANDEGPLIAGLRTALAGVHSAVVDISDYYTVIRVSGSLSRDLLVKGCIVDLHPRAFAEDRATGTGFHHATIFITRPEGDTFDVMIRWGFADYLWDYLLDGARELGA